MKPYKNEIVDRILDSPLVSDGTQMMSDNVWHKINAKTTKSAGARLAKLITYWRHMAAAVVIVSLSATAIWLTSRKSTSDRPLSEVTTLPGSKSRLALPDGTQVWLNGDSKITYVNAGFGKNNREVNLTGEAFFDVVKNEKVPFIIHTGRVNIIVKGTAFNVKAYPGDANVETALVRGLVEISVNEDPDRKIVLKPNEKITISAKPPAPITTLNKKPSDNEYASLYSISKLNEGLEKPAEIAWMNPQLIFDNEPFETIAPKMESWFNITIHFLDDELKKKRFSGIIEKESLKETLEAMKLSYYFDYQIKQDQLWIGNQ